MKREDIPLGDRSEFDIGDKVVVIDPTHEAYCCVLEVISCTNNAMQLVVKDGLSVKSGMRSWHVHASQVQRAERGVTPHSIVSPSTVSLTGQYIFWRWRNDPAAKCMPIIRSFVERQEGRVALFAGPFIPENTGPGKYFVDLDTIDIIGVDSVK